MSEQINEALAQEKKKLPFVHLHVHTEYSMLDGVTKIPLMVAKVKEAGMDAVAISDHGVMHGSYEFWVACNAAGIKPIIGCEIYVSPSDKSIKQEVDGIKYYHLLLLAKNLKGYQNLVKLVSRAHLEGFYYKPRADKALLEEYAEGIICTSACPASPVGRHIIRNETAKAKEWLEYLHSVYKDDFYLELQRHGLLVNDEIPTNVNPAEVDVEFLKEQAKINKQLIAWSKEYNIPLIATTDSHYLNNEDCYTQEVLFAVKDGRTINDPDRRKGYKHTYIKTPEEMYEVFADVSEVLENTQKLSDKVEKFNITYGRVQPVFPDIPEGMTSADLIKKMSYEGAIKKYPDLTDEIKKRIDYELEVINQKGYNDYFLVVGDIMQWCRANNIIVGARGSAGGSVVAYCLDIVNTDPIRWELYFERFLNPERDTFPDIDMDMQDSRRDEVIKYVEHKYGKDCVSGIAAIGRMKTRNAIKDVSRAMGIDLQIANTLSKMVEVKFGKPKSINYMIEHSKEFANIINSDVKLQQMSEIVSKIDGISRHVSTHASGYLITPTPNMDYVPVQYENGSDDRVITQIEFSHLEPLGLMKFDFLGLSNLSIVDYAVKLIKQRHNVDINVYALPDHDEQTLDLFRKGNTTSVFQFESSGMKRYLRELQPASIDDLCFMAAAYRPGPMQFIEPYIKCKHGLAKPEYIIPELEPILANTYGYAIYQEQVIRIAVEIAGYSMGQADMLRRAMGKKKKEVMDAEREKFIAGCIKKGHTDEIANKLFDYMLPFADYGFNKSHSAAYAQLAYITAYLKAHYPIEFMAARLTADMSHPDKLIIALEEARDMKVKVLPPDVNKSYEDFVPLNEDSILYGLSGIKNVGNNVVAEIIAEREKNGPYKSLDDLCFRVRSVNSRSIESLTKVGALNSFGDMGALLQIFGTVMATVSKEIKSRASGQLGLLFGESTDDENGSIASTPLPMNAPQVSVGQKLAWEKELLGMYFTSHPIQNYMDKIKSLNAILLSANVLNDKSNCIGACLISRIKNISTKNGDPMAFLALEDGNKEYEAVVFPKDYLGLKAKFAEGDVVIIKGRCNMRNGEISIVVSGLINISRMEEGIENDTLNTELQNITQKNSLPEDKLLVIHYSSTPDDIRRLREILIENPGNVQVTLQLGSKRIVMKSKVNSEVIETLIAKLPMVEQIVSI